MDLEASNWPQRGEGAGSRRLLAHGKVNSDQMRGWCGEVRDSKGDVLVKGCTKHLCKTVVYSEKEVDMILIYI